MKKLIFLILLFFPACGLMDFEIDPTAIEGLIEEYSVCSEEWFTCNPARPNCCGDVECTLVFMMDDGTFIFGCIPDEERIEENG